MAAPELHGAPGIVRRRRAGVVIPCWLVLALAVGCSSGTGRLARPSNSAQAYDRLTRVLRPLLFLSMRPGKSSIEPNLGSLAVKGTYRPRGVERAATRLPNGQLVGVLSGAQELVVPASQRISISHTGALTVEAWIRPATLAFNRTEGSGYVEFLGKGARGAYEYVLRIYSAGNSEGRGNRVSGYAFNLNGGEGSGSYFQDRLHPDQWIMVVVEYSTTGPPDSSTGWIAIYKDGRLRGERVPMSQFNVRPEAGPAPFVVGTLTGNSYFQGAIAKVAVFGRVLTAAQIRAQYAAMTD